MGLFERIIRVIRSQINSLVSKAEDPEKILEQAVIDMQEDLIQVRQAVAQAIATQKRTERQYYQAQSTADEWYKRAQLALQKGDDHLAKEALTKRKSYQQTANSLKAQIEGQKDVVAQLKTNMRSLESKISEAKTKKDLYIARARSAQASEKLSEMLGGLSNNNATSAFERMEEKVMELEARSEAIASLGSDDLEKQFASLESVKDVDDELAEMKQELLGNKPTKGTLPGSDPSPGSASNQ
jgi:phage shock protein A